MTTKSYVQHTNYQPWGALEPAVLRKVGTFLDKLATNHEAPGLHIEPMVQPKDRRVRTGKVDKGLRAVLFRLDANGRPAYVYVGTFEHDAAISLARRTRLEYHAPTGATQIFIDAEVTETDGERDLPPVVIPPEPDPDPAPPAVPTRSNPLAARHVVVMEAMERLRLDETFVLAALAAPDDVAMLEVLVDGPPWQGEVLNDLAAGYSIEHVIEKLSLDEKVDVPEDASEDERLLKGFEHPAARMQFAILDGQPDEFRRAIEAGDFDTWKVFLHPQQRKLVDGRWGGAFRISGGAGTGKTVVLVHRAVSLARSEPGSRIVATTFTTTLAEALGESISSLDADVQHARNLGGVGIHVAGPDSMANAAIRVVGPEAERRGMAAVFGTPGAFPPAPETESEARAAWDNAARAAAAAGLDGDAATPSFLSDEYLAVVLPQRITTLEGYLRAARKGRGISLNRAKRTAVWQGIAAYRAEGRANGKLSWAERLHVAAAALDAFAEAGGGRLADHVLVDEGQDLHEGHWKFLRALVAEGPDDLFIAEDSQQRIYGRPVVLGQLGIRIVGRSRRLNLNYRTTRENLGFALKALRGLEVLDVDGESLGEEHATSARSGPAPSVVQADNEAAEHEAIADALRAWVDDPAADGNGRRLGEAAVLVYSAAEVQRVLRALELHGIKGRTHQEPQGTDTVSVLTMHRAKGLEFRFVAIPGLGSGSRLGRAAVGGTEAERAAEASTRRSLVYVAATRARDVLVVTHNGEISTILG